MPIFDARLWSAYDVTKVEKEMALEKYWRLLYHFIPSQVVNYFALFKHMGDFARGVVGTQPILFYVSLTGFFLFLTLRAVESRRWK